MKILAYRMDDEPHRLVRLTRFNAVLSIYADKIEDRAPISFLHDHKGCLSVGFSETPSDEQIEFIASAWSHLEYEPTMQWAVADEYRGDLEFTDASS